jgi:hypothetical protein
VVRGDLEAQVLVALGAEDELERLVGLRTDAVRVVGHAVDALVAGVEDLRVDALGGDREA